MKDNLFNMNKNKGDEMNDKNAKNNSEPLHGLRADVPKNHAENRGVVSYISDTHKFLKDIKTQPWMDDKVANQCKVVNSLLAQSRAMKNLAFADAPHNASAQELRQDRTAKKDSLFDSWTLRHRAIVERMRLVEFAEICLMDILHDKQKILDKAISDEMAKRLKNATIPDDMTAGQYNEGLRSLIADNAKKHFRTEWSGVHRYQNLLRAWRGSYPLLQRFAEQLLTARNEVDVY